MIHLLGKEIGWHEDVGISNEEIAGHVHILGQSGMGKSTLIEQLVLQRAWQGEGVCFIDPHGKSAERILDRLPPGRTEDVLYINPACDDYAIGLNILEKPDNPNDRGVIVSEVMRMFEGLFAESWGVRLEQVLRNSIRALLENDKATLLSVRRMLVNKSYRTFILGRVRNPAVLEYWKDEFGSYPDRMIPEVTGSTLNKLDPFISDERLRRIVGQPKSTYDFRRAMKEKRIIIANLSKAKIGKEQSKYLGAMLITKLVIEAMQRDEDEALNNVFPLVIDEVHNFATGVLSELLTESRKGGLALVCAHQFLDQFDKRSPIQDRVKEALLGQTQTKILFQLGLTDAEQYESVLSQGKPQVDTRARELQALGKYRAIVKTENQRQTIDTEHWNIPAGQAAAIEKESNFANAKPTKEVEDAMQRFYESKHLKIEEGAEPWQSTKKKRPTSVRAGNTW